MCNCIKEMEQKAQARMLEEVGKGGETPVIKEKAEFMNKGISFADAKPLPPVFLYFPVEGKYLKGKQVRKWATNVTFGFCPFCGQKYL